MLLLTKMNDLSRDLPTVVVYDLDGVITRKDTFTALVAMRLVRSPLRLLRAIPVIVSGIRGWKAQLSQKITEIALAGMAGDRYEELAEHLGRKFGSEEKWIRAQTVEQMRKDHDAGYRIVIATATERRLAEALLAAAEVPYDQLSASLLVSTPAGLKIGDHRVGARKLAALLELGVPISQSQFVTDSTTDLPTAEAAGCVVLVGASKRTRRRFGQAGVEVIVRAS